MYFKAITYQIHIQKPYYCSCSLLTTLLCVVLCSCKDPVDRSTTGGEGEEEKESSANNKDPCRGRPNQIYFELCR